MHRTKSYKQLVQFLESVGFEYDRTNSKGSDIYSHSGYGEMSVPQAPANVEGTIRRVQKTLGITTIREARKRKPEQIKNRQAVERERVAAQIERNQAEIAELLRQRDQRLDGLGAVLTDREVWRIEEIIEIRENEIREWQKLMTQIPSVNAHAGRSRAEHRA